MLNKTLNTSVALEVSSHLKLFIFGLAAALGQQPLRSTLYGDHNHHGGQSTPAVDYVYDQHHGMPTTSTGGYDRWEGFGGIGPTGALVDRLGMYHN